jgi:hypothetical protein
MFITTEIKRKANMPNKPYIPPMDTEIINAIAFFTILYLLWNWHAICHLLLHLLLFMMDVK